MAEPVWFVVYKDPMGRSVPAILRDPTPMQLGEPPFVVRLDTREDYATLKDASVSELMRYHIAGLFNPPREPKPEPESAPVEASRPIWESPDYVPSGYFQVDTDLVALHLIETIGDEYITDAGIMGCTIHLVSGIKLWLRKGERAMLLAALHAADQ